MSVRGNWDTSAEANVVSGVLEIPVDDTFGGLCAIAERPITKKRRPLFKVYHTITQARMEKYRRAINGPFFTVFMYLELILLVLQIYNISRYRPGAP